MMWHPTFRILNLSFRLWITALLVMSVAASSAVAQNAPARPLNVTQPQPTSAPPTPWRTPTPSPQSPTYLFEFRHPQTKELIQVSAAATPDQELRRFSPKNWKKRWSNPLLDGCGKNHNSMMNEIIEEVPIETLGFALFTLLQSAAMSGGDPGAIKHLYEQNVTDPMTYVSIVAFVAAFQASDKFFKMSGLVFDPCKNAKTQLAMYQQAAAHKFKGVALPSPTRIQRIFAPIAPAFGMGFGMGMSVFAADVLQDKDLRLCAKGLISPVDAAKREEACEKAYETWVMEHDRKLKQYFPDVFSMMSSYLISSYIAMPMAVSSAKFVGSAVNRGAERVIPVVWRNLAIAWRASAFAGPNALRWGMQIGTMIVMVPIQTILAPPMKAFWNTWQIHGDDISESANRLKHELDRLPKANGTWAPEKRTCTQRPEVDAGGNVISGTESYDCTDTDNGFPEFIKKYGRRQSEWRQFLLQEVTASHNQWKDFVLKFQNTYTASYNFYNWITKEIADQRKHRALGSGRYSALYQSIPLKGVHLMTMGPDKKPISAGADTDDDALEQALEYLDKTLKDSSSKLSLSDRANLRRISLALRLADETTPVPELENPESLIAKQIGRLTGYERNIVIWQYRMLEVEKAIRILSETLQSDPQWNTRHVQFPSPMYERIAAHNPYAKLRLLLGDPRPSQAGLEALRAFDEDKAMLDQELKMHHPSSINGRMLTPKMTDYLLASMICGPDATPSQALLLKEKRRRGPVFDPRITSMSWKQVLSSSARPTAQQTNMVTLEALAEDAKMPKAQIGNPNRELTLVMERSLFDAVFFPPRLVKDLGRDICAPIKPDEGISENRSTFLVHEGTWKIGGQKYNGLLDIVRNHLRPELFSEDGTESKFDSWWTQNVEPTAQRAVHNFQARFFKHVIHDQFYPALNGESTDRYIQLGNKMNATFNGGELTVGILPSLKSELTYYLDLIQKVHAEYTSRAKLNGDPRLIADQRKEIEALFHLMTSIFNRSIVAWPAVEKAESLVNIKDQPPFSGLDTQQKLKRLENLFPLLQAMLGERVKTLKLVTLADLPEAPKLVPANRKDKKIALNRDQTRVSILLPVFSNLENLQKEVNFYFALTRTVYLSAATMSAAPGADETDLLVDELADELAAGE
ncbi:MAG: hypothetical protein NDI61_06910 [Bdellovibrionaceae bacterium]|nr:hypothetical protein [Pseudobdellovibrionaceae bacterium]